MFERSVRMLKNIFAAYVKYVLYVAYSSNLFEKFQISASKLIMYFLIYLPNNMSNFEIFPLWVIPYDSYVSYL